MDKVKSTLYLTPAANRWLLEQARQGGLSKNSIMQLLINAAMNSAEQNATPRQAYQNRALAR